MKLENITKEYHTKSEKIIALKDFSYNFKKGNFYAIMGHSGSGKSTLISILGLMGKYTSGKYTINNEEVTNLSDKELSKLRMKYIGFIFQDYMLDPYLKAFENVILPMLINNSIKKEERKKIALKLLKEVGLEERVNHYPKEMSGGEQQRVCLARCLANSPEVILADEPTGNLDENNEKHIFTLLKELSKKGKCVIVVSHSNEIKKYADVVINLSKGQIVGDQK